MKIKELRQLKHLSQMKLAEILNLNHKTLSHYETGAREPDIQTLCLLADYFEVSVDTLIGHTPVSSDALLSDDELSLIADYRMLGQADKERLQKIISALKNVAAAEQIPETDCV
ncbi:MAG: helix-turn-helix domain-containing protein [Clostridia bacterium]